MLRFPNFQHTIWICSKKEYIFPVLFLKFFDKIMFIEFFIFLISIVFSCLFMIEIFHDCQ